MRLLASLSATMTLAVLTAAPAFAMPEAGRIRLAQAASPAGPPTSGWSTPGAPQQAAPPPPSSGWSAPSGAAAAPPPAGGWNAPASSGRDCAGEIMPLLSDAQKKFERIKSASASKKAPVVCEAFKNLAAAEGKVVKYFEDHGSECRVPPDALKARKANYAKIMEVRAKACDAAAAPAPRAPSLSDALGTSRVPTAPSDNATAKRGGAFDTLTGNPLAR